MRVIVDFRLYEKRDEIFISNRDLLAGFLAYLRKISGSVGGSDPPAVVTNHNRLYSDIRAAGFYSPSLSDERKPLSCRSRILSLLDAALSGIETDDQLFVISPFRGIVTLNRINTMLEKAGGGTGDAYVSMALLNSNQNPIRFHTIPRKNGSGRIATVAPASFLSSLNFTSMVKEAYATQLSGYIESQFSPELYAVDEAIVITKVCLLKEKKAQALQPVFAPLDDMERIPLLYELPIFNFSKNSCLTL